MSSGAEASIANPVFTPGTSLAAALKTTGLDWTTSPGAAWVGRSEGGAQSGWLSLGQETWLETTVSGPAYVSFLWRSSLLPFTFLLDGRVADQAPLSGYNNYRPRLLIPAGEHVLRWRFGIPADYSSRGPSVRLPDFFTEAVVPLAEALDDDYVWTTSGDGIWHGQTATAQFGGFAASSGDLVSGETSVIETTVDGPGTLSFFWKLTGTGTYDTFTFFLDGVAQHEVGGVRDWDLRFQPISSGQHTLRWEFRTDVGTELSRRAFLDKVRVFTTPTLGEALDNTDLAWTTEGDAPWFGQSEVSVFGGDAARSGFLQATGQTSTLTTTIAGPAYLSFDWRSSDMEDLSLIVDGSVRSIRRGSNSWEKGGLVLPAGTHDVRWTFESRLSFFWQHNCGWLDHVKVLPLVPLGEALDSEELTWTTGGDGFFGGQSGDFVRGGSAARSSILENGQTTYLETQMTGPGLLSFSLKMGGLTLGVTLLVDGKERGWYWDVRDWERQTYELPAGTHTLRWEYRGSLGWEDTVLLDAVRPPLIVVSPAGGELWAPGSQKTIRWDGVLKSEPIVGIGLYRGEVLVRTLADATENNGVFSWDVPADLEPGDDYSVRIATPDESQQGQSALFAIGEPLTAPASKLVVPQALWAKAPGLATRLALLDATGGTTISATFAYGGGLVRGPFPLWVSAGGAGEGVFFDNVLATLEELDGETFTYRGKSGALILEAQDADHRFLASAVLLNGATSMEVPVLYPDSPAFSAAVARPTLIQNLTSTAAYRSLVQIFNPAAEPVNAAFELRTAKGALIGKKFTKTLGGLDTQSFDPFKSAGKPYPSFSWDNVTLVINPLSGGGSVMALGTTVTQATRDPSPHLAVPLAGVFPNSPSDSLVLPAASWAVLPRKQTLLTHVQITDVTGGSQVWVTFTGEDGTSRGPYQLWNNTGGTLRSALFRNILSSVDRLDASAYGYKGKTGSLRFATQDAGHLLLVTSRTLAGKVGSTFQAGSPRSAAAAVEPGEPAVIQELANDDQSASRIRCVSLEGEQTTVAFQLVDELNQPVGAVFSKVFAPSLPVSFDPFAEAGEAFPESVTTRARLEIGPADAAARIWCIGEVTSRTNGDLSYRSPASWLP